MVTDHRLIDKLRAEELEDFKEKLLQTILERSSKLNRDLFKIKCVLQAPVVSIVCSGSIGALEHAESMIEHHVMSELRERSEFRSAPNFNNMRVVLDLRAVGDVYINQCAVPLIYRWAPYLNARCYNGGAVVVVLPGSSPIYAPIVHASEVTKLCFLLRDVKHVHRAERARDVKTLIAC